MQSKLLLTRQKAYIPICILNYAQVTIILCVSECGTGCSKCDQNGPGLCDPSFCNAMFAYKASSKTCGRKCIIMLRKCLITIKLKLLCC